jgi:hypothetical protein
MFDKIIKRFFTQLSLDNNFFKETVIMRHDGVVLKRLNTVSNIPKTNDIIYLDKKRYQVTSNVFNYDLKCINVWVNCDHV